MDFNLTVEQQQIREEIKKVCKEFPDAYWREIDSKKAYPDAGTQITNVHTVNGVKVSEVKVTTKQGESTAEVTEYGDFLMYGVPRAPL